MFCLNCGKQIEDASKFCPYCGTVTAENTPNPAPQESAAPAEGKPRKRLGMLIPLIAAVVVIVIALVILLGGLGGAKSKVTKAFAKTSQAYSSAMEKAGFPDLTDLYASQKFSQSLSLEITDVSNMVSTYASDLESLGLRYSLDMDMSGQELGIAVTPFYDGDDLITAQLLMDGSKIYIASPELLEDDVYGLDTKTIGQDLDELGADVDEIEDLSFNIFDIAKQLQEMVQPSADSEKAIEAAQAELIAAIEVEKAGKDTIDVNDYRTDCTAYSVVIPQDALEAFVEEVVSSVDDVDYAEVYEEILTSCGFSKDIIDEIMNEMGSMDTGDYTGDMVDQLEEVLDILGDLELQVYIKSGYVMAVTYEEKINGTKVELGAYLGGGKNYVDDLSFVISIDDEMEITLTSTGDHGAKSGTFTDETVLEVTEYGDSEEISIETSYAAKEKENNFSCSIDSSMFSVSMEGQLTSGSSSMELQLEEVELEASGLSICSISLDYSVGSYKKNLSMKSPVMLSELTEDDLMDLGETIMENGEDWASDLSSDYPELINLLF